MKAVLARVVISPSTILSFSSSFSQPISHFHFISILTTAAMSASPTSPARTPTPSAKPRTPPTATASPLAASPSTPQPPIIHPDPQMRPDTNPKVSELHAMFPTVELSVIELVLETCGGSTDRAIEQLLAMSDPTFKPDELNVARQDVSSVRG